MELNDTEIENLRAFWNKTLAPDLAAAVEQRMQTDADYRREAHAYRIYFAAIETAGDRNLRNFLMEMKAQNSNITLPPPQSASEQTEPAASENEQNKASIKPLWLRVLRQPIAWGAIASIIVLLTWGYWNWDKAKLEREAWKADIKQEELIRSTVNALLQPELTPWVKKFSPANDAMQDGLYYGNTRNKHILSILQALETNELAQAEELANNFKADTSLLEDARVDLAYAVILAYQHKYQQALPQLEQILKKTGSKYIIDEAAFYHAIILFQSRDTRYLGFKALKVIAEDQLQPHQKQAQKLLELWTD